MGLRPLPPAPANPVDSVVLFSSFRVSFEFSNLEFQVQSARPVVAAGVVDTPRHSLQRCRSKALKDVGIRKLTLFEISYLQVLKGL